MRSSKQLILLVCLFVFSLESINAQVEIPGTEFMLNKLRLNKGLEGIQSTLYKDIQGDPFIFKDFQKGELYIMSGEKATVNIRYDIYADQMHLKDSNMIYAIIHPEKVKQIEAGDYKFIYSVFVNSPGDDEPAMSSYFLIKTEGKCMLLIKKNIRVQDGEPAKLYQEAKPPKFVATADTYYLKPEGKSAVRIKNKKDLLNVLADKSDALDSYISSNKLGVKEIADLAKIVAYYNSL